MKSKRNQLIVALMFGVLAFMGSKLYMDGRIEEYKNQKFVTIVRAKKGIKAGTPLAANMIESAKIPAQYAPQAKILYVAHQDFLQQELAVDVLSGDYILETSFAKRGSVGRTLSEQLDAEDYRAITIPADEFNSFSRSIVAGDQVDILFTFSSPYLKQKISMLLMQSVPVISTGPYAAASQEMGGRASAGGKFSTLTLKVTSRDAARLNYARQSGTINLMLRGVRDSKKLDLPMISGVQDILAASDKENIDKLISQADRAENMGSEKIAEKIREQAKVVLEQQRKQFGDSAKQ